MKQYPDYVQKILQHCGDHVHVRNDSTSRFRYVISLPKMQIRLRPESGVMLPPKPSRLQVRYATTLTHEAIVAQLRSAHSAFEIDAN